VQKKLIFILLILSVSLIARDNPFSSVKDLQGMGKAITIKDTRENFSEVKMILPSTARILKEVELHYQNLDGSIQSKTIKIDEKIDWHDELVLQKIKDTKKRYIEPIKVEEPMSEPNQKVLNFKDIISFAINDKKLHVTTDDVKIRDFLITNPYKIVLDFKRELAFTTKKFNLTTTKFKDITIGKHDGYYRVVILLDGQYKYTLQKINNGFIITLK